MKWVASELRPLICIWKTIAGDNSRIQSHMPLKGSLVTLLANRLHPFSSRDGLRNELFQYGNMCLATRLFATPTVGDNLGCFFCIIPCGAYVTKSHQDLHFYVSVSIVPEKTPAVLRSNRSASAFARAISHCFRVNKRRQRPSQQFLSVFENVLP